ncbi:MAG: helix-turn-helix domain-containing protein [Reyranella sp.]|uniref:IclR family transcriptional regulator domain-containing protein n=1 Tax=Reyranella sp. TaxID=1929291 RepID=UPI001AD2D032|nr:IclR family transcriptional regulator C-terminal domain-containing protein [Reyranella sp.]MBN9091364.1 helix-turn-helix domain-containing protein [Reyranella sp.]
MARLREQDAARRAASGYGPDFLEAFARGLRVIRAFDKQRSAMSLSDVARATDLPKPSVRRALYTLTCLGLATSDGRTFRLTPKVMELASVYLGSNMISTVVQPACERLAEVTEQSCFAAVLDGHDIMVIAHSMHGRPDVLAPTIGLRRPAFNTAAGRAILSQLSDEALDAWLGTLEPKGVTDFTITDKRALRQQILHVRKEGFAITAQEWRRGYHAAAVPLRRYDGVAIGALCVAVWMEDSSTGSAAERHVPALTEEARALQPQLL